ncbi:YraN family protein [Cetobacterium sp. 8H]|uniref:YraN family protein n=1 Tax=Cetobacterium sp. 8H TaxID=2759681 RepID=UPI00163D271E|nr:YraN family protein [Cetobacterium sp. 8H]MBC2850808.1 YraN family protein [Cetobacterium sp. 8H]
MNNRSKGHIYEVKAREYLERNGVKILDMNYQGALGEIDIIGYENSTLVFFEVKYRKNNFFGMPQEAIHKRKQVKIYKTAREFIKKNRLENEKVRFDAVVFLDEEFQWLKNIFWGDDLGI